MLKHMREMAELVAVACTAAGSADNGYRPDDPDLVQTTDPTPSGNSPMGGLGMM
ncbi:MAG: hypothetical protein ACLFP8_05710 [Alphaproteobacteria bacterium]